MITFLHIINEDLHPSIDPPLLRPVQNTFLKKQNKVLHIHSLFSHTKNIIDIFTENYFIFLFQFSNHDDDRAVFLPDHLPEVIHRVDHWTLSGNEGSLISKIALDRRSAELKQI